MIWEIVKWCNTLLWVQLSAWQYINLLCWSKNKQPNNNIQFSWPLMHGAAILDFKIRAGEVHPTFCLANPGSWGLELKLSTGSWEICTSQLKWNALLVPSLGEPPPPPPPVWKITMLITDAYWIFPGFPFVSVGGPVSVVAWPTLAHVMFWSRIKGAVF